MRARGRAVGPGAAEAMMAAAAGPAQLPAVCNRRLAEFLRQVDETDLVWLKEIREEAARMFSRYRPPPLPHRAGTGRSPR